MNDDFGDRMKLLEQNEAGRRTLPLLPVCVRLDGKGFSKYTKNMQRPYDERFSNVMMSTTKALVENTNACIGYTQSDEISLILHSETYESQIFFDGKIQKIVSVLASMATAHFNRFVHNYIPAELTPIYPGLFDCRVWNVPTKSEAANAILWREQDATKNAISMAARHYYSHKELMNQNGKQMQEMLFKKGVNFNDYPSFFKRGTFFQRRKALKILSESELALIPEPHRSEVAGKQVERTEVVRLEMPPFGRVKNRVEVVFNGAVPVSESVI